jgi:tyrosyl-tRNA synthetase
MRTLEEVATVVRKRLESGEHPNVLKKELAQRIVTMYHGKPYDESDMGNIEAVSIFNYEIFPDEPCAIMNDDGTASVQIGYLLKWLSFCATSWDVRNALSGNSIRVNGEIITDAKFLVTISPEGTLIEMGKKKAKRVFL